MPAPPLTSWVTAEENENRDYNAFWYGVVAPDGQHVTWDPGQTPPPPPSPPVKKPDGPSPVPPVGSPEPVKAPK